jgi:hypothetical protein
MAQRGRATQGHPQAPGQPVRSVVVERVTPWKHVVIWVVGVIIASLIPFLWTYASNQPNDASPNVYQVLGHGDLYLIAIIVLIAGITEIVLLLRKIEKDMAVALLIIGGFLFVLLDAGRFAGASAMASSSAIPHSVTYWSIVAFIVSAVHSSICVGLAAGAR